MKCEKCNKNDATINFTEIKHKHKKTLHLCESCAKNNHAYIDSPSLQYSTSDFTTNLIQLMTSSSKDKHVQEKCSVCNTSYDSFQKTGRLGCAKDYKIFRSKLKKLLFSIHGSNKHCGKVPYRFQAEQKIATWKSKLQLLIQSEDYEKAAILRDKIKKIEENYNDAIE